MTDSSSVAVMSNSQHSSSSSLQCKRCHEFDCSPHRSRPCAGWEIVQKYSNWPCSIVTGCLPADWTMMTSNLVQVHDD